MARYLSDIRASVRDVLRDEFEEGVDLEWETDELNRLIALVLGEMEQKMPYEVKAKAFDALSTVATELSATATNLVVASDDDFPTSFSFYITIEDEVLKVTALASSENFTVTRAQKNTTAAVHAVGKSVGLSIMTSVDEREIDITNIADLIRVFKCEYRIDTPSLNPKQFRNFSQFADVLTMEINFRPVADEEVHLYLHKKHTLTDATSTLQDKHETVLIQGVAARAAMDKGREQINALNVGGVNVGPRMVEWGKDQLSLYRLALRHHTIEDDWEALPKD
jgi:hypothetical protein